MSSIVIQSVWGAYEASRIPIWLRIIATGTYMYILQCIRAIYNQLNMTVRVRSAATLTKHSLISYWNLKPYRPVDNGLWQLYTLWIDSKENRHLLPISRSCLQIKAGMAETAFTHACCQFCNRNLHYNVIDHYIHSKLLISWYRKSQLMVQYAATKWFYVHFDESG